MAQVSDQDKIFLGIQKASTPKALLEEGEISRLINGTFSEGSITNAIALEELEFSYSEGNDKKLFASNVTYGQLLTLGDLQLVAPLDTFGGQYLILIISGYLLLADLFSKVVYDITPKDSFLPESSFQNQLSYLDNSGGRKGVGGYQVIFNYPNRPIFINENGARISDPTKNEMPVMRLGITAGIRFFGISGDNILWSSDPLGGDNNFAPLTFDEVFEGSTGFTGQLHIVGSALDVERATAMARLPKFLGPSQEFLAQNFLVSTTKSKYIIAGGAARNTWPQIQFITYAGSHEGIAGPLAVTNVGDNVIYISRTGRVKTISQDASRETGMLETFIDDPLGQYFCCYESNYQYRKWYEMCDHSRSVVRFNKNRLFASVGPMYVPAINKNGEKVQTLSHRALAVASIDPRTLVGPQASFAWEGFFDFVNPVGIVTIEDDTYVVSKDVHGRIRYFRLNTQQNDSNVTTVITRGYFPKVISKSKSLLKGDLFFNRLSAPVAVNISYLANGKWICASEGVAEEKHYSFTLRQGKTKTWASTIPLKIEITHKGCPFELERVLVNGEAHAED